MLTHVVLMKFADTANIPEAKARLEVLTAKISEIRSLHVGIDVVRSPVSYDLCLTTTHRDVEELQAYQAHPAHVEFGGWLRPLLTDRVVVDYIVD